MPQLKRKPLEQPDDIYATKADMDTLTDDVNYLYNFHNDLRRELGYTTKYARRVIIVGIILSLISTATFIVAIRSLVY